MISNHLLIGSHGAVLVEKRLHQPARFQQHAHLKINRRREGVFVKATSGDEDKSDELNKMFQKELEKRGIEDVKDLDALEETKQSTSQRVTTPPPSFRDDYDVPPQLQMSRELNSEGLEGLIPRATQLVQLGVSFFLAFGPFILAVIVAFAAVNAVFGDLFIHGGSPSVSPPPQYDPNELLSEPTVDPMIPM